MDEELKEKIRRDTELLQKILKVTSIPIVYGVTYFGDSYTLGCIDVKASVGDILISLDNEEFILDRYDKYDYDIHKWIVYLKKVNPEKV